MVKCFPEFEFTEFTVFLKNKNIIFKIRRSKVTDYADLTVLNLYMFNYFIHEMIHCICKAFSSQSTVQFR